MSALSRYGMIVQRCQRERVGHGAITTHQKAIELRKKHKCSKLWIFYERKVSSKSAGTCEPR